MTIENRAHPRFAIRVPLYINVEGRVFKKKLRIHSRDISAGGLSFTTRQKLPIDARSKVIIGKLGDFLDSAHIEGMVVYLRRDKEQKHYAVGVEFTRFVDVEQQALAAHLRVWESLASAPATVAPSPVSES
ncbi:MAG TPA: PilZ domain-containing protein [Vicinamibacteria bacterium]